MTPFSVRDFTWLRFGLVDLAQALQTHNIVPLGFWVGDNKTLSSHILVLLLLKIDTRTNNAGAHKTAQTW